MGMAFIWRSDLTVPVIGAYKMKLNDKQCRNAKAAEKLQKLTISFKGGLGYFSLDSIFIYVNLFQS